MRKPRETREQFQAREHYENYVKSAFAAACVAARAKGWTWIFEGSEIVVTTDKHTLVCSDRLDFFNLVRGN